MLVWSITRGPGSGKPLQLGRRGRQPCETSLRAPALLTWLLLRPEPPGMPRGG